MGAFLGVGQGAGWVLQWGLLGEAAIHFYCLFDGLCFSRMRASPSEVYPAAKLQ